jgi:hypothetical protein
MENKIHEELLSIFESLLRAQLNTIRQLRKRHAPKSKEYPKEKRMSQMDMVYNILLSAQRSMHVDAIITEAQRRFNIKLDKESLVSALAKRIKRQDRFVKIAPNTFSLISHDLGGGPHATS